MLPGSEGILTGFARGCHRVTKPQRPTAAPRHASHVWAFLPRRQAGRLKLRRWTVAGGAFCDIDLDLRKAEIHDQRTAMSVVVVLGNVDVYVPENINITVTGLAVGGHRREWGEDLKRRGAPEITVRAISVFGTVDVWRVPADMPSDYGKVTLQLQKRERELPP